MRNTGRSGKNSNYLVILLLFVGLTAFSNSMKELAQLHQLTLDAGRSIASWTGSTAPVPVTPVIMKVKRVESCESKQSLPAADLPWLETEPTEAASGPFRSQQFKMPRAPRPVPAVTFDAGQLVDREIILKTLNRSINLRIAS